jgi:hypothetical protein
MEIIISILIVVASLILLYFAFFKNSNLGKLSVFVVFGSILLQELLSILGKIDIFDFISSILSTISTFVVYGEVILLVLLLITKLKESSNKYMRISLIILIILKVIAILGIF